MPNLTLTIQSTGSKSYRLGISNDDSKQYFVHRKKPVVIKIGEANIETHTTCGPPLPKGFDLYSKKLNSWIMQNGFHIYPKGNPTKLEFDLLREDDKIILTFKRKI